MGTFKTTNKDFRVGDFKLIEESTDYTVTPSKPSIFVKIKLAKYLGSAEFVCVPDNVNVIESAAFYKNVTLREIHFPESMNSFSSCISDCPLLESIYFYSTDTIKFSYAAFSGIDHPIRIYYSGRSETFLESIAPRTETESYYDNGWGGGAPWLYTKEYEYNPMHHPLGNKFYAEVACIEDGKEFKVFGVNAPRKLIRSTTPYD
jgi:hypothetical protein